jgi:hypothetical protein
MAVSARYTATMAQCAGVPIETLCSVGSRITSVGMDGCRSIGSRLRPLA